MHQPYYIHSIAGDVLAFAGLWSRWLGPDNSPALPCALLSRDAALSISAIHHRMPVVLKPEYYAHWMSAQTSESDIQATMADARHISP